MSYRKFLLIIVFCLLGFVSSAQMLKAYAVVGLNASQIDGDEVFGYEKFSPQAGLGIIMPFNMRKPNEGWQASAELLYSQKGAKEALDPFRYNTSLHYVDIPIMVHFVDVKGGLTFGLGGQYGRLFKINEDWGLPDTLIHSFERPVDGKLPDFKRNDFSIVADIRFTIWEKIKFSFRYQYSLTPIREDVWFYNSYPAGSAGFKSWSRDFRNNYMSFRIIYMINERSSRELDRNINRTSY
ncbi:MAG: outer membrane beta-barrel protein [Bacteroidales bacterium]|nr:outer membrane beta-barrel protein [Bacteroidales bacterium]